MIKKLLLLLLLQPIMVNFCYAEGSKIRVWEHTQNKPGIIGLVLHRALEVTSEEYGDYELVNSGKMEQDRALRELVSDRLDIAHFVPTIEREFLITPIRIPIMQGLLGYRLCLINENNQETFEGITNKQQWIDKGITIGQHQSWPDTTILKSNGINVHTTFKRDLLFYQLSKGRFDCFSRGISEISNEKESHKSLPLAIEGNIVIYYPLPQFFFVNPSKPILMARLQTGLMHLQKSGELNRIFDNYYLPIISELNLKQRTFIPLQNPTLSPMTIDALLQPSARFKNHYLSSE